MTGRASRPKVARDSRENPRRECAREESVRSRFRRRAMNRTATNLAAALLLIIATCLASGAETADGFRLSGPYSHKNLTIFLVHGKDRWTGPAPLTLQEALAQKKAVVHETGVVQELSVENLSGEQEVYIQSGDIVKGGKQDRLLVTDLVLPPKSGKVPIAAFCVEPGRWSRRGKEAAEWFASSNEQLPSKDLKMAARVKGDQQAVWNAAAVVRQRVSKDAAVGSGTGGGIGRGVGAASGMTVTVTASSLPLALETSQVRESAEDYTKALASVVASDGDVLGFAFAVNGQLSAAEVFASRDLFRRMWPKLLKASAIEAMSEYRKDLNVEPVAQEGARRFLDEAASGAVSKRELTGRISLVKKETDKSCLFETWDKERKESWVHRSYLAKD
jgi:hypothetical protein